MFITLRTAIQSGMKFDVKDFGKIMNSFRAGYWIGESGERLYALAAGSDRATENTSFCLAYEHYMRREPFLWAERTKTPARLHVGERFTWKGQFVTITSFNGNALTACTYKNDSAHASSKPAEVGEVAYTFDGYRKIEAIAREGEHLMVRYGPKTDNESTSIARRFKITLEELQAARKEYDARRKSYLKEIEQAQTLEALETVVHRAIAEGPQAFRHFDSEQISDAYLHRKTAIREGMTHAQREQEKQRAAESHDADLTRWMNGEDVYRSFNAVRLRVKGDWVETTTNQKATVKGVRLALAFIKKHRAKGFEPNGSTYDLDHYPIHSISEAGVQVGCTLVEWSEVDRIAKQLI